MAKNAVLQLFYHVSVTIQLSEIKPSMHIYADSMPIHVYFHSLLNLVFLLFTKKCILV